MESDRSVIESIEASQDAILVRCAAPYVSSVELIEELRELRQLYQELIRQAPDVDVSYAQPTIDQIKEEFRHTFFFREIKDREDNIAKAHARTYEWVLQDLDPVQKRRTPGDTSMIQSDRKSTQNAIKATLDSIGVDTRKSTGLLTIRDPDEYPTAPLQEWLRSEGGTL